MSKIVKVVHYATVILISFIAVLTVVDGLGRYLFNFPLRGTVELTEGLLAAMAGFAVFVTTAADEHIKIDTFAEKLPSRVQHILKFISAFIGFVVLSALCWQNFLTTWDSMMIQETLSPTFLVPTYPFHLILTLGYLASALSLLFYIVHLFRSKRDDSTETGCDSLEGM